MNQRAFERKSNQWRDSMETSEQINELAGALSKAQSKITGALKDSSNPFFKSKYADLASCWDACRAPLTECGLAVIQTTQDGESGTQVVTRLVHSSGQWVQGRLTLHPKDSGPQAVGSTPDLCPPICACGNRWTCADRRRRQCRQRQVEWPDADMVCRRSLLTGTTITKRTWLRRRNTPSVSSVRP